MLLAGCLLNLLGCASAPSRTGKNISGKEVSVTGTYVNAMSPAINIELKEDGTFCNKFGKRVTYGKYIIDGDRAIFTSDSGKTFEFMIKEKALQTKEGAQFIRQ